MDFSRKEDFLALVEVVEDEFTPDEDVQLFSDSDSDNETLFLEMLFTKTVKRQRNCIIGYVEYTIPSYTEKEFVTHFRVSRKEYQFLATEFNKSAVYNKMNTSKAYLASIHIILFLWFAAHEGCSFRSMADRFNLALGTISHMIHRVITFISGLSTSTICWPNEIQMAENARIVQQKNGIPGVIGKTNLFHVKSYVTIHFIQVPWMEPILGLILQNGPKMITSIARK